MAKSVLYMSTSLDGFITGPDDGPGNGLGDGGLRLHDWLGEPVFGDPGRTLANVANGRLVELVS